MFITLEFKFRCVINSASYAEKQCSITKAEA